MLDEAILQKYIQLDPDVSNYHDHGDGLYQFDGHVNGQPHLAPANIVLTTKVNTITVLMLTKIDASGSGLAAALAATGQVGVVGLAKMGDAFYLRYAFFRDFAEPLALTNGIQALTLAYNHYLDER